MARYAYDVNTTQRYIDVHKQFQGGLKTVDTDDALGAVFLRDAQNISISEFGFLEKRYGTFENFKSAFDNPGVITSNTVLQGYWEFLGKYAIVALDGKIYSKLLSDIGGSFDEITNFYKKDTLKYPSTLALHLNVTDNDSYLTGISWQATKPMGAANIANVLYVFTGTYPFYIVEESNNLKAYLFAKEDPTYAELVVTGYNLLEDDYDDLYYTGQDDILPIAVSPFIPTVDDFRFKDNTFFPRLPYADGGTLDFKISYDLKPEIVEPFVFNQFTTPDSVLNTIELASLKYRPSGPGATDLDFVNLNTANYTSNILNNVPTSIAEAISVYGTAQGYTSSTTEGSITTFSLPEQYWTNKINTLTTNGGLTTVGKERVLKIQQESSNLFELQYKDIEIEIDDIPTVDFTSGDVFSFRVEDSNGNTIDIEDKRTAVRNSLNTYNLADSRVGTFLTDVRIIDIGGTGNIPNPRIVYTLFYLNNQTLIPVYSYRNDTSAISSVGNAKLEYSFVGTTYDNIQVKIYDTDGNLEATELVQYVKPDNTTETLSVQTLRKAYALTNTQRSDLVNALSAINKGTVVELIYHQNNHSDDYLIKRYVLGSSSDIVYDNGNYKITLPEGLPPSSIQHYAVRLKTVDVKTTAYSAQTSFLNQTFNTTDFYSYTNLLSGITSDPPKYFYPNVSQFVAATQQSFDGFSTSTSDLYPVSELIKIASEDDIGVDLLEVTINKGLLSGTYDFEIGYYLKKEYVDYSTGSLEPIADPQLFTLIIKDISITQEKLTDYSFFQGDKAHPIWSCNNVIEHFNKLMVWGSDEMPTALFYSFPDRPFYFPSKFYLDFTNEEDKPLVNVTPFMNILVAQTEDQTWGIRGNSGLVDAPSPYVEFSINNTVGTIAPKSVRPVRNHLFFLSKQGVIALKSLYAADEQYNIDFVDRNIRNIVPQESGAVGIQFDNQYWLNFPKERITLRWYIDKKAWVLDKYNAWNEFNGVFKYQVKDGQLEFITLPSKFLETDSLNFYKVGVDYSLPTDLGGDVFTKIETSFLNQNYPFHPKNYKEAKLDFTIQNEYNLSQNALYTLETSEDILDNIHTIDNVTVLKNHRYRIIYNFSQHTPEEDIVTAIFTEEPNDLISGGDFSVNTFDIIGALTFSILGAQDLQITEVRVTDSEGVETVLPVTVVEESDYDEYVEFVIPNNINGIVDIQVIGQFSTFDNGAVMYDVTYDNNLTINTWIMSESQTLNLDNLSSYDQAKAALDVDFNGRLGTWEFGSSDFGNKVTAVKTVKLSGKGYNSKVYIEDTTKSKWTLESLGLTYKMKRARSR